MNFGVKAPEKRHQWTAKDRHEFDALEQALADAEQAMERTGTEALHKANLDARRTTSSNKKQTSSSNVSLPKITRKQKRSKTTSFTSMRKTRQKIKEDIFTTFVKAAKFVRGIGAGTIHPSAKLKLFGLLMQAQRGNTPDGDLERQFALHNFHGSALILQKLKLNAWQSQKDKKRKVAMEEYVELVKKVAPQWKVAHFVRHESFKDSKPKPMMWVLKVKYRELKQQKEEAGRRETKVGSKLPPLSGFISRYRVTSIEVLQSSNATSARLWVEEGSASKGRAPGEEKEEQTATASASACGGGVGGEGVGEQEQDEHKEEDPFVANIPEEWSLADCIVDKSKFKTIEEQRGDFQERMREMARADRDEEDGWKFYCKTKSAAMSDSKQCVARESKAAARTILKLTLLLLDRASIRVPISTGWTFFSALCRGPPRSS